jgi:hypothetical protein
MAIKKCGKTIYFSVKDNRTGFNVEHVLARTTTARGMGWDLWKNGYGCWTALLNYGVQRAKEPRFLFFYL